MTFDVFDHNLVPYHEIMSDEEIEEELKNRNYDITQLPKIKVDDPISKRIGAKEGQILRIIRESETAGISFAYRIVIGENQK